MALHALLGRVRSLELSTLIAASAPSIATLSSKHLGLGVLSPRLALHRARLRRLPLPLLLVGRCLLKGRQAAAHARRVAEGPSQALRRLLRHDRRERLAVVAHVAVIAVAPPGCGVARQLLDGDGGALFSCAEPWLEALAPAVALLPPRRP
eukprot:4409026-Alexandrium_andersonii.AAC.1